MAAAAAAATALRGAARKLVGRPLVQRTVQAAEQRRLSPRLLHTKEMLGQEEEEARAVMAIQEKKEELYNMMSEARARNYNTGSQNNRLHISLSAEISPRPYDSTWRWFQKLHRIRNFMEFMVNASMVVFMIHLYCHFGDPDKEAQHHNKEEKMTFK